jgi:multidrug resistance efflux pump
MQPTIRRILVPLAILAASAAAFAALYATRPKSEPVAAREKTWLVDVRRIDTVDLAPQVSLYGRVESPRTARLTAAVAAEVMSLNVLEGQRVEEGQILISLDDSDYLLAVEQREAELAEIDAETASETERHRTDQASLKHEEALLDLAARAVERARDLARKNMGSQAGLDEALQIERRQALTLENRKLALREHRTRLSQLEARRARVKALRDQAALDLARTRIVAPFPGQVMQTQVAPGDRVRVGDPLLELYDTRTLEIRAQIPTRHLGEVSRAVREGLKLQARARVAGQPVRAVLDRLAGQVRRGSGGLDGLFRIGEGDALLQPGRTVELLLDLPVRRDVVALPIEALYGTSRAYKLEDNRMQGITVERIGERRGPDGERQVLLRSPSLTAGDRVIVTQLPNAMDGLRVRVAEPAAEAPRIAGSTPPTP